MNDIHDFQDRGEPWRKKLGIDGTAGDAQDVNHPYVRDSPDEACVVCGMAKAYEKHADGWIEITDE